MKSPFQIFHTSFFIISLVIMCTFSSCRERKTDREAIQVLIEAEAEKRLATSQRILMRRCRQDILEEASRLVDSMLVEEARLRRDTTGKPPRPDKPEKPEIKTLLDSTPIQPFLLEEGLDSIPEQDSLGN